MGNKSNSPLFRFVKGHLPRHLQVNLFPSQLYYRPRNVLLRDRLSERDIVRLIMAYKTGIATKGPAEQDGINVKSVRKVLHGRAVK